MPGVLSLIISTIVFFVALRLLKRYVESLELPKGATRGALIFSIALLIAYVAGWLVDRLAA